MLCERCWSDLDVQKVEPPINPREGASHAVALCKSCRQVAPEHPLLFHRLFLPFASRKELLRYYHTEEPQEALSSWSSEVGLTRSQATDLLSKVPNPYFPRLSTAPRPGRIGIAPYGYRHEKGKVVPFPPEAKVVETIFDDFLGGSAIRSIASELNLRRVKAKQGGRWRPSAIHSILRNPLYTGFLHRKGFVKRGDHQPLVDFDTYRRTQFELVRRCRVPSQKRPAYIEGF